MSLDLAILAEDGTPEDTISLSVNLHHDLIVAADKLGVDQVLRLRDYYGDVEFRTNDLSTLAAQVETMGLSVNKYDLRKFLADFDELIIHAAARGKTLYAIAD
jgi:hypothetical protein